MYYTKYFYITCKVKKKITYFYVIYLTIIILTKFYVTSMQQILTKTSHFNCNMITKNNVLKTIILMYVTNFILKFHIY